MEMLDTVVQASSRVLHATTILPLLGILAIMAVACGRREAELNHIPALANFSWIRFLFDARNVVMDGCKKHPSGIFRLPKLNGWTVVVHTPQLVEDLRKAPEDVLSFSDALKEFLQMKYTLGSHILENPYHIPIIRNQLTRGLPELFDPLYDEIVQAFQAIIPSDGGACPVLDTIKPIICRASNRIFVGLPLCRNPQFIEMNIQFTVTLAKASQFLFLLPSGLRPLAASLFSNVRSSVNRVQQFLDPLIESRMAEMGTTYCEEDAHDFLAWLLRAASTEEKTPRNLSSRILMINTAAIHTTSMAFAHAIFYLATYTEYVEPLREEILQAVAQEGGWNYFALSRMIKLDSFIRETQRLNSLSCLQMDRIARKQFVFSNGTVIPPGTHLQVASCAAHYDRNSYGSNPELFDPFRFVNRSEDGRKSDMTSTHADFVAFGHGRHACPGRFFAAMVIKTMFAHLIVSYDINLIDRVKPPNVWIVNNCIPNPKAKVEFHPRKTASI